MFQAVEKKLFCAGSPVTANRVAAIASVLDLLDFNFLDVFGLFLLLAAREAKGHGKRYDWNHSNVHAILPKCFVGSFSRCLHRLVQHRSRGQRSRYRAIGCCKRSISGVGSSPLIAPARLTAHICKADCATPS